MDSRVKNQQRHEVVLQSHPSGLRVGLIVLLTALLAGCGALVGTTIVTANNAEISRDHARLGNLVTAYLESVKELQAKGDPMGDYLWVRANEDGLVENPIKDPKIIIQMYADAATKGSEDAQIVLAIKRFYEGQPRHFNYGRTPEEMAIKEPVWRDGLGKLERATQQRCYYLKPYIFAPHNKRCLAPRVAADDIWPSFRNGYSYPKDPSLRDYWYDKAIACDASPEFQQALRDCPVFGRTSYRAKD